MVAIGLMVLVCSFEGRAGGCTWFRVGAFRGERELAGFDFPLEDVAAAGRAIAAAVTLAVQLEPAAGAAAAAARLLLELELRGARAS